MKNICCGKIWGDYRYLPCIKPAKFEVDGKHYCGIHNPNKGPTKAQIQASIDFEKRMKMHRLNAAAPDLLEALQALINADAPDYIKSSLWDNARAAVSKATGETI